MNNSKKKRLESNGWKLGDAAEFLNLSPEYGVAEETLAQHLLTVSTYPSPKESGQRAPTFHPAKSPLQDD